MSRDEIRDKIMTDDVFVLEEVRRIQYFYNLQKVIRHHRERTEELQTESVAEHIYGMCVLAEYFSVLENLADTLNMHRVYKLITWHDSDEIETGDVIGYLKTDIDRKKAEDAKETVLNKSPVLIRENIREVIEEYQGQATPEAKFVKAIDKMDPIFFLLNENGKEIFKIRPATEEQYNQIKDPYIKDYPYMVRFSDVTNLNFREQGYYVK